MNNAIWKANPALMSRWMRLTMRPWVELFISGTFGDTYLA